MRLRRLKPHWGNHIPTLIRSLQITTGNVIECGCGFFSTPLLHWMCFDTNRKLYSYEGNEVWYNLFSRFNNTNHTIEYVDDWETIDLNIPASVAVVDHQPDDRRWKEVIKLSHVEIIVLHDADKNFPNGKKFDLSCGYNNLKGVFKYQYVYSKSRPYTAVVSNYINVSKFFG
jgi:hypothetical protein